MIRTIRFFRILISGAWFSFICIVWGFHRVWVFWEKRNLLCIFRNVSGNTDRQHTPSISGSRSVSGRTEWQGGGQLDGRRLSNGLWGDRRPRFLARGHPDFQFQFPSKLCENGDETHMLMFDVIPRPLSRTISNMLQPHMLITVSNYGRNSHSNLQLTSMVEAFWNVSKRPVLTPAALYGAL